MSISFHVTLMCYIFFFFFFNDTATTEIYTLSLHDALPICLRGEADCCCRRGALQSRQIRGGISRSGDSRSEEHTSELQSPCNLVCRLLLEKKKKHKNEVNSYSITTLLLLPIVIQMLHTSLH